MFCEFTNLKKEYIILLGDRSIVILSPRNLVSE